MIPVTKLKKKLENHAQRTSDKEIEQIIDIQNQLADIVFDMWIEAKKAKLSKSRGNKLGKKLL